MGWGGSALAANQIIKNNRAMLKRRKKGRLSFIAKKQKWVDPKTATFEQLMDIKKRIKREEKLKTRRLIVITFLLLTTVILVIWLVDWNAIFGLPH